MICLPTTVLTEGWAPTWCNERGTRTNRPEWPVTTEVSLDPFAFHRSALHPPFASLTFMCIATGMTETCGQVRAYQVYIDRYNKCDASCHGGRCFCRDGGDGSESALCGYGTDVSAHPPLMVPP